MSQRLSNPSKTNSSISQSSVPTSLLNKSNLFRRQISSLNKIYSKLAQHILHLRNKKINLLQHIDLALSSEIQVRAQIEQAKSAQIERMLEIKQQKQKQYLSWLQKRQQCEKQLESMEKSRENHQGRDIKEQLKMAEEVELLRSCNVELQDQVSKLEQEEIFFDEQRKREEEVIFKEIKSLLDQKVCLTQQLYQFEGKKPINPAAMTLDEIRKSSSYFSEQNRRIVSDVCSESPYGQMTNSQLEQFISQEQQQKVMLFSEISKLKQSLQQMERENAAIISILS